MVVAELGEAFEPVLDAARCGEAWAFERLFQWLGRPVASYLRGAGADDPDGLANEVFLRAFTRIGGFSGDERRFRSWVFTIAHHRLVDDHRRRSRRPSEVPLESTAVTRPSSADTAEEALSSLDDDRLRALLGGLPDEQRTVLLLRLVADLSAEETAAVMGKSNGAVRALQHRAVSALRRTLEVDVEGGVTR